MKHLVEKHKATYPCPRVMERKADLESVPLGMRNNPGVCQKGKLCRTSFFIFKT